MESCTKCGISCTQGGHQVAQKSRITRRPFKSLKVIDSPESVVTVKSGAGFPTQSSANSLLDSAAISASCSIASGSTCNRGFSHTIHRHIIATIFRYPRINPHRVSLLVGKEGRCAICPVITAGKEKKAGTQQISHPAVQDNKASPILAMAHPLFRSDESFR